AMKILTTIFMVLMLSSCDYLHTKDYYISNEVDEDIEVRFSVNNEFQVLTLPKESKTLIFKHEYPFGTVGVSDARYEDLVSSISVRKDSVKSDLDESKWNYIELNKYHAEYTMIVDSLTF